MTAKWVWVSLPWATFGLEITDGRVTDAAPIARWCIGREEEWVADYWHRRGATTVVLPEEEG